jgi:hypothetical protein
MNTHIQRQGIDHVQKFASIVCTDIQRWKVRLVRPAQMRLDDGFGSESRSAHFDMAAIRNLLDREGNCWSALRTPNFLAGHDKDNQQTDSDQKNLIVHGRTRPSQRSLEEQRGGCHRYD